MNEHVCPRDRLLTAVSLVIGVAVWAAVALLLLRSGGATALMGAGGMVLMVVAVAFLAYLLVRSAAIAHLRGNAIEVGEEQLPELYRQLSTCCEALGRRTARGPRGSRTTLSKCPAADRRPGRVRPGGSRQPAGVRLDRLARALGAVHLFRLRYDDALGGGYLRASSRHGRLERSLVEIRE